MIRILHWPSFLDRCRAFRKSTAADAQETSVSNFPSAYATGSAYDSRQSIPFAHPTILPSDSGKMQTNVTVPPSDAAFGTLLYSVYFASLVSIIHSPNPPDLDQNVNAGTLWATFKSEVTTRISKLDGKLARADSIEMLQAMILYISVELGTTDCQLQWLQLGTAIRMAQSSGVHRDPSNFGFDPVEIEIRRRLWAQICILDTRLAEQLCREPTITPESYDVILPLSLSDQELTDIDRDAIVLRQGQQQQLLCFRYQPRDRPISGSSTSPQMARRATPFGGRPGRISWVSELQERYTSRYQWDRLENTDPMQYLVSEVCQINILKATFISRLAQRKEASGPNSTPSGHSEAVSIFHDALQLATRCAALSHQYSASPLCWYTRRIREASSCSFLALVLASDLHISHEATNAAWAVLDQLFVPDSNGETMEPGLRSSLIGKVLAKARMRRETGGYQMHMAQYPPISSPANLGRTATFQPSGNLFEDWDALMQEPIWPAGVSAADHSYWQTAQQYPVSICPTHTRRASVPPI
ncbi:hypothetical protein P280DRAFT_128144 [Massarina eburnea CBS 473.64]|uniref:Xylanolytic transcriptional activator regulatory domain-containing protein n=1 Tax=Massarina eburnea CBS 473.64 TaxID=1395130 RepID=A0A6A6SEK5_9PLEO|nr:hypothetical protein P280DRAFT_128144 [Massarina eburnea CBS 473.64]